MEDNFEMNERQQKYYDILCKIAEERGCKILGKYTGSKDRIKMICPNNHVVDIRPDHFKRKNTKNCPKCSKHCPIQAREELYQIAEERNYRIVGEYITNTTKITMICPRGHKIKVRPHNFKQNSNYKCSSCCLIQNKEK